MLWWTLTQLRSKDYDDCERALQKLAKSPQPKAVGPILASIASDSIKTGYAIAALVTTGPQAVEALITALTHKEWRVRDAAAKALGKIGDKRAVASLIATLEDQSPIMEAAAEALGLIGDARAVEPLIIALTGENRWRVGRSAARALGKIGGTRAVEALLATLNDKWEHAPGTAREPSAFDKECVREAAAQGLGESGDARALARLIIATTDESYKVREAAAEAVPRIDPNWGESEAARSAVPHLIAALISHSEYVKEGCRVRAAAAKALGEIRDTRAVGPLITALADRCIDVPGAAAEALRKQTAKEPAVLTDSTRNKEIAHRPTFIPHLDLWEESEAARNAVPQLIATLTDGHHDVHQVARLLSRIDPHWPESETARNAVPRLIVTLSGHYPRTDWYDGLQEVLSRIDPHWPESPAAQNAIPELAASLPGPVALNLLDSIDPNWKTPEVFRDAIKVLLALIRDEIAAASTASRLEHILENYAATITVDDLQSVSSLGPVIAIRYSYPEAGCNFAPSINDTQEVDCSRLRQLARQELIRRGFEA